MPKVVDYPLASFPKVKELADAVDYLGGSCTIPDCAHYMKKKVSGGFGVLISSAIKHDLIVRRRDRLFVSDLYKKIKFSYNAAEKIDYQRVSFFHPILYRKILERFRNKELPVAMLDKLLIREFQVEEKVSAKIAGFFVEGIKRLQLLQDGKLILAVTSPSPLIEEEKVQAALYEEDKSVKPTFDKTINTISKEPEIKHLNFSDPERFTVTVAGDGLQTTIVITSKDDYMILEAILEKIKKTLP